MVLGTAPPRHLTKQTPDDILRIADRLEPKLRKAFLASLDALQKQIPLDELTGLVEAGNTALIGDIIQSLQLPADLLAETQQILLTALTQAATQTGAGFGLSFTLDNPLAVRWAETQTGHLITGITGETRQAVADIVHRGMVEGIPPRTQARSIERIVGLTRRDANTLDRYRAGLHEAGMKPARADELADRMRQRMLRRRAENIARTETANAANQGQLQAWRQAADDGLLNPQTTRRVWSASPDDRTCPICAVLDGHTVGFTEPFISTEQATGFDIKPAGTLHGTPQQDIVITGTKPLKTPINTMTPTAHPQCRCSVVLDVG